MTALLPDRAWSTWDPGFPACMVHQPTGFAIRVTMFSATENRYDDFPATDQQRFALGEHALDGSYAALQVASAGTTLAIEFARAAWSAVLARVRIVEPGEMLFRLGILVETGFLHGSGSLALVPDRDRPWMQSSEVAARSGPTCVHVAVSPTPALSGAYADRSVVRTDLETRGWLYHPPELADPAWTAMRFYGDPRRTIHVAAALGSDPAAAAVSVRGRLVGAHAVIDATRDRVAGGGSTAARAVRDVVAWNTVWDSANHRPYTSASRAWLPGFGGWGIWMSDAYYAALLAARAGDPFLARANLHAVMAAQQPAGNVPCLAAADETWVDRTQLPVAAFLTWRIWLMTGDRSLLREVWPVLVRQLTWQLEARDGNGNGLYEYGSSPTGHAQGAGTRQGALNESGMDNLAVFDDAVFVPEANTVDLEDPGHNALIALELRAMGWIADELGLTTEASSWRERADALRDRIAGSLWDADRGIFAARMWDGSFSAHVAPTSFFPLLCGAADDERVDAMLEGWLWNPERFGGPLPLPSAPLDDPVGLENAYWRGKIWAPHLYWTWEGLHACGRHEDALRLARRAWELFEPEWTRRRHCHENFHGSDPARHEAHDSDPFYTWGALIPLMWDAESGDASPWEGLVLAPGGATPYAGRTWTAVAEGDSMDVRADGAAVTIVTPAGRHGGLELRQSGAGPTR